VENRNDGKKWPKFVENRKNKFKLPKNLDKFPWVLGSQEYRRILFFNFRFGL
jgi:hypothetical protein